MARPSKYPEELRERAVRMVAEIAPQHGSQWAAITAVADKLGVGAPETVRTWVRRAEVDAGKRPGVTWRDVDHVEIEALTWVDWFNTERAHEYLDDLTPARAEELHYIHTSTPTPVG